MKRPPLDPTLENDSLLQRMRENVLRLGHQKPESVVTPINDAPERTRQAIRQLARSRIGQVLRQLRAAHGFSYEELQARTGLSQQTLFDLEFKDRRLSLAELRLLADCFDISVGDLLGIELD
ncbi:MAG: helix-turn-helix domain-containing protein [Caldilineaceae bacterium]